MGGKKSSKCQDSEAGMLVACLKRRPESLEQIKLRDSITGDGTDNAEPWPRGATPRPRSAAATKSARLRRHRSGQEELPHIRNQGWRPRGASPHPRSSGCMGAGGPRGAIPRSRSGGAASRRYPSSKVRSSSCALLEQL